MERSCGSGCAQLQVLQVSGWRNISVLMRETMPRSFWSSCCEAEQSYRVLKLLSWHSVVEFSRCYLQ